MKRNSFLYKLIYGPPAKLRGYEELVIKGLREVLPEESERKLENQLKFLQPRRQTDDRVLLYSLNDNRVDLDSNMLFNKRDGELLLAAGQVRVGGSPTEIGVKVFVYAGRLSSIQFSQSPKEIKNSSALLSGFRLVNDPDEQRPTGGEIPPEWSGVVKYWSTITQVRAEGPALSDRRRNVIIDAIGVHLPSDYLDAVSQAEGLDLGLVQVFGLSNVGSMPLRDGELVTIAQVPKGIVGVLSGSGELALNAGDEIQLIHDKFGQFIADTIRVQTHT